MADRRERRPGDGARGGHATRPWQAGALTRMKFQHCSNLGIARSAIKQKKVHKGAESACLIARTATAARLFASPQAPGVLGLDRVFPLGQHVVLPGTLGRGWLPRLASAVAPRNANSACVFFASKKSVRLRASKLLWAFFTSLETTNTTGEPRAGSKR